MEAAMDGAVGFDLSVMDRIRAIIAEQAMLDLADVTPEARLSDLGLDSLGLVESLFAIEEAFDISVPFNANDAGANDAGANEAGAPEPGQGRFDVSTVAAIIAGVERLLAAR